MHQITAVQFWTVAVMTLRLCSETIMSVRRLLP